jgi:hemoglobin
MDDIQTKEDIYKIITTFYTKGIADDSLGPVFKQRLSIENWDEHMETITNFWSDIILKTYFYSGRPFPKHLGLGIKAEHFARWLSLFHESITEMFEGENAQKMHQMADQIGQTFSSRIEHIEGNGGKFNLLTYS